ncbi:MAG: glycosyltransferase [Candidatus Omnitrophica bacterium]|nr:glycosyltransferase [Candidatus Omnitrophota bacterium]
MRGGEKCLEVLCELYPESPVYALFYEKGKLSPAIAKHPIIPSWLQRLPGIFRHYRYVLPLFPKAVETLDLKGYDLIVSTSHCVAKGVRKDKGARHLCYCFTPMRYAWSSFEEYFGRKNRLARSILRFWMERLKKWDLKRNEDVDAFVAISGHVKGRIREYYGREAEVIYPPVDTDFYTPDEKAPREDFYLAVSALAPYKRMDTAVRAFSRLGRKLVVIGSGPEEGYLKSLAGKNVVFLGWQADGALRDHYRRAKALIFPGEEDFGIVPLEMQACGGFAIAYGRGGALETVVDGKTGIFFREPAAESLEKAVLRFEKTPMSPLDARENALRFSRERFKREMKRKLESLTA